jgi:hypothetical protein
MSLTTAANVIVAGVNSLVEANAAAAIVAAAGGAAVGPTNDDGERSASLFFTSLLYLYTFPSIYSSYKYSNCIFRTRSVIYLNRQA